MKTPINDLEEYFWSHVDKTTDCWLWTGSKHNEGYGRIRTRRPPRNLMAHRVSYEINVGPIPKGLTIDHLCRNKGCVNPKHLESVTNIENIMRGNGLPVRNSRKTHCVRGHEFTPENIRRNPNRLNRRLCIKCEVARNERRRVTPRPQGVSE